MLLAKASFSRKHHSSMELIPQGLIPRGTENEQEGVRPASALGYRMTDYDVKSSSLIRTTSMHKASECRFLTWVAYTRNFTPKITASQRCTCPMTGCELQFESSESMLQHVQVCPRLSKGLYRCFESGKEERIGKCNSKGCQELKGRIVTAVNSSLRSVKRHFSGRRSRSRRLVESSLDKEVVTQENFEMNATWDGPRYVAGLSFDSALVPGKGVASQSTPCGLDQDNSGFGMSELSVTDNSTHVSTNHGFAQGFHSELSTGTDAAYLPLHRFQSRRVPVELDVSANLSSDPVYVAQWRQASVGSATNSVWDYYSENAADTQAEPAELCARGETRWMYGCIDQQHIGSLLPSQSYIEEHTEHFQSNLPRGNHFLPLLEIDGLHQPPHQRVQTPGTFESSDKIVVDEQEHPLSQVAYEPICPNMYPIPRMGSGTSSDTSMPRSVFSTVSNMSNCYSSMSSLDSSNTTADDCYKMSTSFFGDESQMMCEEPEPIEPFSLPLRDDHHLGYYSSSSRRTDSNGVSIDSYIQPSCYLSNMHYQEYRLPNHNQRPRNPTLLSSPDTATPPLTNNDNMSTAPTTISSPSIRTPVIRKVTCKYCGRKDPSNLSRHERACKINPHHSTIKHFKCHYPGCGRAFTRNDNLLVHQRAKNHLGTFEFQVRFTPQHCRRSGTWR